MYCKFVTNFPYVHFLMLISFIHQLYTLECIERYTLECIERYTLECIESPDGVFFKHILYSLDS